MQTHPGPIAPLLPPGHGLFRQLVYSKEKIPPVLFVNVYKMGASIKILREVGCECIVTMPSILEEALPHLLEEGIADKLRWILMAGENCSPQKRTYFKKYFPNAFFDFSYGFAESVGVVAYRCLELEKKDPNIFHPLPERLIEVIDDNGRPAKEGEVGEIVVTSLQNNAFPLIRYRTGDAGILRKSKCMCGREVELELLGRINNDFIRVSGLTLHEKALALAISEFSESFEPRYMLEIHEKEVGTKIVPELRLKLIPKCKTLVLSEEEITKVISKNLKVSTSKNLVDAISMGIISGITVEYVSEIPKSSEKYMSIVSYLNK
jgi:phenylacetate-coenzyme A ligase PaaK-like adenylate-forming protein